ncbi:MAG: aminoacyl-tRNA hydrolase [Candidatus Saccharibacteria bacterium]|nr:aminoacyl-tRNA hydrolase [Candidatus Saccharibacteria bacterium]
MALFQKNPFSTDSTKPLYTLSNNKTILIVGLGNMGTRYHKTRHNLGFTCVDAFAKQHEFPDWAEKGDLKAYVTAKTLGDTKVLLAKPTTMMNLSGEAVQAIAHFYKVEPSSIVVVHDEAAIPFGQIRTRMGGSSAGHNGIKSITKHIGEDFGRVRIGVEPAEPTRLDMSDYVLARMSEDEESQLPALLRETSTLLTEYVFAGELGHETRSFLV